MIPIRSRTRCSTRLPFLVFPGDFIAFYPLTTEFTGHVICRKRLASPVSREREGLPSCGRFLSQPGVLILRQVALGIVGQRRGVRTDGDAGGLGEANYTPVLKFPGRPFKFPGLSLSRSSTLRRAASVSAFDYMPVLKSVNSWGYQKRISAPSSVRSTP